MRRPTIRAFVVALFLSAAMVAQAQWVWTPQARRWVNLRKLPKETPELQVEYARGLMLQGEHKKALRETNKFADFYADSDRADENQFLRGEILLAQGKHLDAAKEFQQVVVSYPDSSLYKDVIDKQYEIGDQLYELGQAKLEKRWRLFRKRPLKRAIEAYTMVIDNQPVTDAAAEAQYKVGLCHFTREEYADAALEYRHLIEAYGASDWVDDASYGFALCYYQSSLPAEYDQAPARLAVEAMDDFKERFPGDERVAKLEPKREELLETIGLHRLKTAQFYEKRRQFPAARIYYQVVAEQFPETSSAEKAREWLTTNPAKDAQATVHRVEPRSAS